MEWVLTVNQDQEVTLNAHQLIQLLSEKAQSANKTDIVHLAETATQWLQEQGILHQISPVQLAVISINIGYFYKVFLQANNVEIRGLDETNDNSSMGISASPAVS